MAARLDRGRQIGLHQNLGDVVQVTTAAGDRALLRVSGIILLVPGSVGFRSLSFVLERDVVLGLDTAVAVLSALIAIVAGLLFGNLLVPPRRYL